MAEQEEAARLPTIELQRVYTFDAQTFQQSEDPIPTDTVVRYVNDPANALEASKAEYETVKQEVGLTHADELLYDLEAMQDWLSTEITKAHPLTPEIQQLELTVDRYRRSGDTRRAQALRSTLTKMRTFRDMEVMHAVYRYMDLVYRFASRMLQEVQGERRKDMLVDVNMIIAATRYLRRSSLPPVTPFAIAQAERLHADGSYVMRRHDPASPFVTVSQTLAREIIAGILRAVGQDPEHREIPPHLRGTREGAHMTQVRRDFAHGRFVSVTASMNTSDRELQERQQETETRLNEASARFTRHMADFDPTFSVRRRRRDEEDASRNMRARHG